MGLGCSYIPYSVLEKEYANIPTMLRALSDGGEIDTWSLSPRLASLLESESLRRKTPDKSYGRGSRLSLLPAATKRKSYEEYREISIERKRSK
jgi:hypothetical protein